ncbi:MAG: pirin family protein [Pontibacterium sp.]
MSTSTVNTEIRKVASVITAQDTSDGAGVRLKRSIGQTRHVRADPFLMLDAFNSANAQDYIAGFPPHPHRGFETVTYMLNGSMIHRDHMGNEGELVSGGVQWMTAGKGVIHEERPQRVDGLMRGFQLWVNLPAAEKMKPAAYQNIEPEEVPKVNLADGSHVAVVAGQVKLGNDVIEGPVKGVVAAPIFFDLTLKAGGSFEQQVPHGHTVVVYVFEGRVDIAGSTISQDKAAVLSTGDTLSLAANQDARCLVLAGKPIGEPVVQYGPFVMNTPEEVKQAVEDYNNGVLTD